MTFKTEALVLSAIAALASICVAQESAAAEPAAKGNQAMNAPSKVPGHAGAPTFQPRNPRYLVEAGDSFDLMFELSPEFNQTVWCNQMASLPSRQSGICTLPSTQFPN